MARAFMLLSAAFVYILLHLGGTVFAKTAKCNNPKYKDCHNLVHVCPKFCPGEECKVNCRSCRPVCSCDEPGTVCQDPRFVGGDGLTFYFHGKKDKDFCLLSDPNLHINAHFIGKRNPLMKRDFTWVQSLGLLFGKHQIYVGAMKTAAWDDCDDRLALSVDGEPILLPAHLGATWHSSSMPGLSITRTRDANGVAVELKGKFKIETNVVPITKEESRVHGYGVTDDDCMAHLNLGFKFYSLTDDVSGVLGQTYGKNYVSRVKMGVAMAVMGGEKEFAASSLFAPDCAASRFVGSSSAVVSNNVEVDFADLQCSSRMSGAGVVCKR